MPESLFKKSPVKKETLTQLKQLCQSTCVHFAKFLRTSSFTEHLRWLLLKHAFSMTFSTKYIFQPVLFKFHSRVKTSRIRLI